MLASRRAPVEKQMHRQKRPVQGVEQVDLPNRDLVKASRVKKDNGSESSPTNQRNSRDMSVSRPKKKVVFRGKTCVIALPQGEDNRNETTKPLSSTEVDTTMRKWEDAGYRTHGFDIESWYENEVGNARARAEFPDPQEDKDKMNQKDFKVYIPDPKAWSTYVEWLMEQRLAALGVSIGGDDPTPNMSRQHSGHRPGKSVSPAFNLPQQMGHRPAQSVSPAFNAPLANFSGSGFSHHSTPTLSNFSTAPHSRTMSVASPLSAGPDYRGHGQRHSVFGMPFGFQQQQQVSYSGVRALSPLQHVDQNGHARGPSPSYDRLKSSVSPLSQERLSPLPSEQQWGQQMHARHQSMVSYPGQQPSPMQFTPRPVLAEVPEDEDESHRSQFAQIKDPRLDHSLIAVPTPRGHRHNISESLEREIHVAEASMARDQEREDQFRGTSFDDATRSFTEQNNLGTNGGLPDYNGMSLQPPGNGAPVHTAQQSRGRGHGSKLSVAAPEFRFNPSASSLPAQNTVEDQRRPSLPRPFGSYDAFSHRSQPSTANLDVSAPSFEPMAFQNPAVSATSFDFSSAYAFKPVDSASQRDSMNNNQPSIFGNVVIPDVVRPTRKSKAVSIVKPNSPAKEAPDIEDEDGRIMASEDRQKRARFGQDDGDSVPLFAERSASPLGSTQTQDIREQAVGLEHTATVGPDVNPDNGPRDSVQSSLPTNMGHKKRESSLSANARPFEFNSAAGFSLKILGSPTRSHERDGSLELSKPDLSPAQVFSQDAATFEIVSPRRDFTDPEKHSPILTGMGSPHHPDPSFDEIDAVMKQLNEQDGEDSSPVLGGESPSRTASEISPRGRPVTSRSDAPSPSSVKPYVSHAMVSRCVSPPPDGVPEVTIEEPTPAAHRLNRSANNPASEWSEAFAGETPTKLPAQSRFLDNHIDEVVGSAPEDQPQPLRKTLCSLQRSVSAMTSRQRESRCTTSSGIESDADDEDDLTDSKFISRPIVHGKDMKLEAIRSVVLDALSVHRTEVANPSSFAEIQDVLVSMSAAVARMASTSLDLDDVRDAVAEALVNQSRAMVPTSPDRSFKENHKRQVSELEGRLNETLAGAIEEANHRHATEAREAEAQRLRQLAEEELSLLRANMSDKDQKIYALQADVRHLNKRTEDGEVARRKLKQQLVDMEDESAALESTLDEYRTSSTKWRQEIDDGEIEKEGLRSEIAELKCQLEDGLNIRDNMRSKLESIQTGMVVASQQLANEKRQWQSRNEELHRNSVILHARLEAESQSRATLALEMQRLQIQASEGATATLTLEHTLRSNLVLEESLAAVRNELAQTQALTARLERELQDARENRQTEMLRAQALMEARIKAASAEAHAVRAGLESRVAITTNELENMQAMEHANKARHEILLQEEAELRRDTLHKVNEASSAALDDLRKRHEEEILYVKAQRDRAVAEALQSSERSTTYLHDRLNLSEATSGHLRDRVAHLEERLEIAKTAAQAAVSAAQAARVPATAIITSKGPEKISPQALRESILVLQEQLQERETRIERLQSEISALDIDAPNKLKERDIEINWLRELLALRGDELSELIDTLFLPSYDREAVRDTAIRIKTNLQMEQQEKERLINAGSSLTGQALAGLTNFASPKAVQLAAAIGSWRNKGRDSGISISTPPFRLQHTPSKVPSSAASFLSGLMTPQTSSPSASSAQRRSPLAHQRAAPSQRPNFGAPKSRAVAQGLKNPETPLAFRRQSFDDDAELGAIETCLDEDDKTTNHGDRELRSLDAEIDDSASTWERVPRD